MSEIIEAPTVESFMESDYAEGDSAKKAYADSARSILTSATDSDDYRILWIRDKIMKFLGLDDSLKLFNELINANNREIEEKLLKFLNTETYEIDDLEYKQVFFYKTYRDEIVQEEVSIWEEGRAKIAAMGSFAAQVKSQRLVKSAPDEKSKKKSKKSRKSKAKLERDESIKTNGTVAVEKFDFETALRSNRSTGDEAEEIDYEAEFEAEDDESSDDVFAMLMRDKSQPTLHSMAFETERFVPPPGEEDNYILTRKVVERVVRFPVLHCLFGELNGSDPDLTDQRLIYLIRTTDCSVAMKSSRSECWANIPRQLIVGSLQGRFIDSMGLLLKNVFLPLVETQFRGPEAAEDKTAQASLGSMMETPGIERAAETLCKLKKSQGAVFAPPSSVRRLSLLAAKIMGNDVEETGCADGGYREKLPVVSDSGEKKQVETSKAEFVDYLAKLIESVEWTRDHVEADSMLTVPEVFESTDPRISETDLANNRKLVEKLEEIVMSWEKHIKRILESYRVKSPQGSGPIAEYSYWHERESGLSLLVEQLRSAPILRILAVLNTAQSAIGAGFSYFDNELNDCYNEAKENNKFLSTVLRYFKIMEGDSLSGIANAIPSLYEHLRMIWVLSKYYSTEERMISLLERISWQLRETVMRNLSIKRLFKEPLESILKKTDEAHEMLKLWKSAYLDTRNSIELSGKGARWEFDQRRLFKDTDYLASSSANLNEIAGVLRDFYNIFGEELKSIVSDPARIDAINEQVGQLLGPILMSENDAFNEYNRDSWEATISWFHSEVERLEAEAKLFIDECFVALIRAEDALTMLMKFRNMKTREAVQERLSMKFDIIMQQFGKEIDEVEELFNKGKRSPTLLRYHPPIAGAIYWERQLFHRMKSPVLIFQDVKELKNSELKNFAFEQYVSVAKQMKNFEDTKFEEFVRKVQPILHSTMRSSVLTLQPLDGKQVDERANQSKIKVNAMKKHGSGTVSISRTTSRDDRASHQLSHGQSLDAKGSSNPSIKTIATVRGATRADKKSEMKLSKSRLSSASTLTDKLQQQIVKNTELMRGAILVENQMKLAVNFNAEVFELIREAELLEHLGFELPESIREIGIQKYRLYSDCEAVEKMISQYNDMINKFDDADILLLKTTLENVEKNIQPGVTRLNWYSLGIDDYASGCSKLLKSLSSLVTQINQIRHDLDSNIDSNLCCYNLFTTSEDPDQSGAILPYKTFFTEIESKRTELISVMLKYYHSISPMLIKLESLVEETATGKSQAMLLYYERYEHKLFTAFITCFVRNLEHLKQLVSGNKPIFQVNATFVNAEVALKPSAAEIYTMIMRNIKDLMERLKVFPRWMARSCLECKPIKDASATDFVTFSFYEDVMSVQLVNELIFSLQDTSHRLAHDCHRYLHKWKQYGSLWSADKPIVCEKFAASNPTLQQYDEKFSFYASVVEELDEMTDYYDVLSIRINLQPLLSGIKNHALEWKKIMGDFLLSRTLREMEKLKATIDKYRTQTEFVINGLEKFKLVMQTITDVKRMAIQAEVKYLQYQETFKILRAHKLTFAESDEEFAHKLQKDWESLYLGALYRLTSLESTKDQFREMTMREIEDFSHVVRKFVTKFQADGPGSCGDDLDAGMLKMENYGTEMKQLEQKVIDLTNAELLFDLSPADYTSFKGVQREYQAMAELYKMYKLQKIARENWAKTLWADLNPHKLLDGMDGFLKEFRKLSKPVRNHKVGRALEASMKSFKDSVPLFVELKNEAMRERHWKELMDKTGKHFDMAPDRLDGGSDA